MFGVSFALVLLELALTRVFAVVLFATFAHLALALALLGIAAGALAQHLWPSLVPEEGLLDRVGWLALYLGGSAVVAVIAAVRLPITVQFAEPPVTYGERSSVYGELIDPLWFPLLLPLLALPFAIGGLAFAGVFERRKAAIGELYAADLVGGAVGALVFVPLLYAVSGPDAVWVVALAGALTAAACFAASGARTLLGLATTASAALAILVGLAATGSEHIPVRYAAGYSEENVTWVRWTPLTRLALHEDERGTYMLLDNTSASEVILDRRRQRARAREPNRSAVYLLHDPKTQPDARIAILAASAGPEVAVAQLRGFRNIDAIDIAPEIGSAVAERFADAEVNPFREPGVTRVLLDGRAAILHAERPYDVIQMVHANLHSSAGLLSAAWSPALLETKEAFDTYFDHLDEHGTLSFARGSSTHQVGRAVVASLRDRGVEHPERHLLLIRGHATVLLAKKRPFTVQERNRVRGWIARQEHQHIAHDPLEAPGEAWTQLSRGPVLTDAHPYFDRPGTVVRAIGQGLASIGSPDELPVQLVLYRTLGLQAVFVLLAGVVLLGLPRLVAPERAQGIAGGGPVLGYVACLGYGYLAVETVLIHELVLFVGHPTYAITVVILAMLLCSGIGALLAQRVAEDRILPVLRAVLVAVLVLGAIQAWIVPELLHATALGLPLGARAAITFAVLAPLGLVMGMPFPLGIRSLRPDASPIVPWAWAMNGWMSVVATLGTVLVARALSYPAAFAVALVAYAGALALAPRLERAGNRAISP